MTNSYKKGLFTLLALLISVSTRAQFEVQAGGKAEDLVKDVLIGEGIKVRNILYKGSPAALGAFTSDNGKPNYSSGLLLSTGKAADAAGPNKSAKISTVLGKPGNRDLGSLANMRSFDASSLEFDFMCNRDSVTLNFFFASDEYNESVGNTFNDVFAVVITGPGVGNQNFAVVPGTQTPITINSINVSKNKRYYLDNNPYNLAGKRLKNLENQLDSEVLDHFQYDGMTRSFSVGVRVQPKKSYKLKILISDIGDGTIDSGVFLEGGSFRSLEQDKHRKRREAIRRQQIADSLAQVRLDSIRIADSLAIVQARIDSIENARMQHRMDSMNQLQDFIPEKPDQPIQSEPQQEKNIPLGPPDQYNPGSTKEPAPAPDPPQVVVIDPAKLYIPPGPEATNPYMLVVKYEAPSYLIPDSSQQTLLKVVSYLNANPETTVSIFSPATEAEEDRLPGLRMKWVRYFLIGEGIDRNRINDRVKGFLPQNTWWGPHRLELWFD